MKIAIFKKDDRKKIRSAEVIHLNIEIEILGQRNLVKYISVIDLFRSVPEVSGN